MIEFCLSVWEFFKTVLLSGWGLAAVAMEGIDKASAYQDKFTSQKWWAKCLRWICRSVKKIHLRWIAGACIFLAAFLAWNERKTEALDAMRTVETYKIVESRDKERIEKLRDLLAIQKNATVSLATPNVTSNNQSGGITAGTINLGSPSRHLSQFQKERIKTLAVLLLVPGTRISVNSNTSQEAKIFAMEFVNALKSGGANADLALPIPELRPNVVGIHLGVRDKSNLSPVASAVANILTDAKISFHVSQMEPTFFPDEQFVLVVGAAQ